MPRIQDIWFVLKIRYNIGQTKRSFFFLFNKDEKLFNVHQVPFYQSQRDVINESQFTLKKI